MPENKREKIRVQDIAKILNISASTVSRALNDHPRISRDTKEKVKKLAIRMGYQMGLPDLMAPEKAEVIAVLTPSLENEIYRNLIAGITDFLDEHNYRTFVVSTNNEHHKVSSFFESYKDYGIGGMVHLVCSRHIGSDFYKLPVSDAIPMVTVFEPDEGTEVSSVQPDMYDPVLKALKHLKSVGVNNVSLLLEDENKPEDNLITASFQDSLELLGFDGKYSFVDYLGTDDDAIIKKLELLLTKKDRPGAVIIKGVISALQLINVSERLGLKIPEDLLLIAIGSSSCPAVLANNLSIIKLPTYEMGQEVGEILLHQINNPGAGKVSSIKPVNFILKGSAMRMKK